MQKITKSKSIKTFFILLALSILVVAGQGILAFTAPTATPPSGNTNPPLNDSPSDQTKTGGLALGSLAVTGGSALMGNVGIGTTTPSASLHILGVNQYPDIPNADIVLARYWNSDTNTRASSIFHAYSSSNSRDKL